MLPVQRSQSEARAYYDRLSKIYDWLTASERSLIETGVRALSPQPGETLLEIGCGTGTGLAAMAGCMAQEGRLFGLDLSFKMLQKAQEKDPSRLNTIQLINGTADMLPLPTSSFDGIYCAFTLELFSQLEITAVLNEIHRILKPDGRLVVVSLAREPHNLMVRLYEWGHRAFPVALDCRPIPLERILEASSYKILSTQKFMNWGLPVDIVLANG